MSLFHLTVSHLDGCIVSQDVIGYEDTKSQTCLQDTVLFKSLLNLNCPWGSAGWIWEEKYNDGWITSVWQGGRAWVVLWDRLKNCFRALGRLLRPSRTRYSNVHEPGWTWEPVRTLLPELELRTIQSLASSYSYISYGVSALM